MLKRLTRKLFILFALIDYFTLAVPSTSAQGSGYEVWGRVDYNFSPVAYAATNKTVAISQVRHSPFGWGFL